jgi:dTDP-6-deoxy-L-talose 4-dehydrogenase (NAD+)
MKVFVTGATGFLGRHVITCLRANGHQVTATIRRPEAALSCPWLENTTLVTCDLHRDPSPALQSLASHDALIHLAWPGLPNYLKSFHLVENLAGDLRFIGAAIEQGLKHLIVAGSCLEYGMQYGPLREDQITAPHTAYGLAKDSLRKSLQMMQTEWTFTLQWIRLFYTYGEGQNTKSLLPQLDHAIATQAPYFNLSPGDQLRDYLPVATIAKIFVAALETPSCQGIINSCRGKPVSVYDFVDRHCRNRGSSIDIRRGFYPYPTYEPLAFWGHSDKLAQLNISLPDSL